VSSSNDRNKQIRLEAKNLLPEKECFSCHEILLRASEYVRRGE
jgi:hypothetical protein